MSGALHVAAVLAVFRSELLVSLQVALALSVLYSLLRSWQGEERRAGLLVREREEDWWLQGGPKTGSAILATATVWRYLVVMDFLGKDAMDRPWRRRVVVLPDAVAADTFRRLRVRLKYGRRPVAAPRSA